MNSKKVNLRFWAVLPIIPAFLLTVFYWMYTIESLQQYYNYIQYPIIIVMLISIVFLRSKKDIDDESAQEAMAKTNAISIKLAYIFTGLVLIGTMYIKSIITIGFLLSVSILMLAIARAVMFSIFDRRGI